MVKKRGLSHRHTRLAKLCKGSHLLSNHFDTGAAACIAALDILRVLGAAASALLAQHLLPYQHFQLTPNVKVLQANFQIHIYFWPALFTTSLRTTTKHLCENIEWIVPLTTTLLVFLHSFLTLLIINSSLFRIAKNFVSSWAQVSSI